MRGARTRGGGKEPRGDETMSSSKWSHSQTPTQSGAGQPGLSGQRLSGLQHLQRTHGNQAVQRLVNDHRSTLELGDPDDRYEREAERVATAVVQNANPQTSEEPTSTPHGPRVQRLCSRCRERAQQGKPLDCPTCETELRDAPSTTGQRTNGSRVQRASTHSLRATGDSEPTHAGHAEREADQPAGDVPPIVDEVVRSPGRPLEPPTRQFMERRFGSDFGSVRVHTSSRAAESARTVDARAYTVGGDVVFGAGEYRPETTDGRRILAHELTHVLQQAPGTARTIRRFGPQGTQTDTDDIGEAVVLTREEEINQSRTSPGRATIASGDGLSLYNFSIDRSRPKEYHTQLAGELARFLRREVTVPVRVRLIGHASSPGPFRHNDDLARRRAEAVAAVLQQAGLSVEEITSRGENDPVASNDTVEGRSRNRRVDIQLFPGRIPAPTDIPEPPGPEPPEPKPERPERERNWCERYPRLCDLGPGIPFPFPFPIPFPWPVICILAPELCAIGVCILNPALCISGPPDPPDPPDRPKPPKEDEPLPSVEFTRVRAANTPPTMGDRIPDQGSTAVLAIVTGPSMPISIVRMNANPINGEFLIDGGAMTSISGTTALDVAGTKQTTTAAAGFPLSLQALTNGQEVGRSAPFAVAAIFQNMQATLEGVVVDWESSNPEERGVGLRAKMTWGSDGADGMKSLDQVFLDERLELISETGGMIGLGLGGHGFGDPDDPGEPGDFPVFDYHGTVEARMQELGEQKLMQLHVMVKNNRTGEKGKEMVIPNSGFVIMRRVEPDSTRLGCLQFVVSKVGTAGSIGSHQTGAGAGAAEPAPVPIPCDQDWEPDPEIEPDPDPEADPGHEGGSTPSTQTTPREHTGPMPPGRTTIYFADLFPAVAVEGLPVRLQFHFVGHSSDQANPERRVFTSSVLCLITDVSDTHVVLRTLNTEPLNFAPPGFEPAVMPVGNIITIRRSLLE